jgi:hypothetical protein
VRENVFGIELSFVDEKPEVNRDNARQHQTLIPQKPVKLENHRHFTSVFNLLEVMK